MARRLESGTVRKSRVWWCCDEVGAKEQCAFEACCQDFGRYQPPAHARPTPSERARILAKGQGGTFAKAFLHGYKMSSSCRWSSNLQLPAVTVQGNHKMTTKHTFELDLRLLKFTDTQTLLQRGELLWCSCFTFIWWYILSFIPAADYQTFLLVSEAMFYRAW